MMSGFCFGCSAGPCTGLVECLCKSTWWLQDYSAGCAEIGLAIPGSGGALGDADKGKGRTSVDITKQPHSSSCCITRSAPNHVVQ